MPMTCASCSHANPEAARFCNACGAALARRCPGCGTDNPPGSRFCNSCGVALIVRPAEATVARKVVTIVFADLIGSTSLHERLDAESTRRVMDRYYRTLRAAVEAHGGTVVKLLGDGVMAAFGVPRVAEDDAIRAVRAAVAMQRAFGELLNTLTPGPSPKMGEGNQAIPSLPFWERRLGSEGLGLRVAVNTGEVVVSDDHTDVVGDPVNVAARLQQEAHDGDVLVGESTRRLLGELVTLAPLGVFSLKGRSETVAAYRVVSLDRPAGSAAVAFVGRDDELRRIMFVYDTAVAERRARLAVVLGSPGLGKSRLLDESVRRLGNGATVLNAHCDAAGGATFAPLAEALRALLRIDEGAATGAVHAAIETVVRGADAERTRIADGITALLAGSPAAPEETFFVVRRLLAALAATQPVVLVIDDLQWAEPLLLDLVEHLVQWSTDVPLLVLAAARPELRDTRSSLAAPGGVVADFVTLGGLDAAAATRLAANVIGAAALPAAVAGRVLATSEGNPLFVGELVRMLVHDGALKQEGDQWTIGVELAALEMPPTIHAVLAARIERLRPEERTVLERAAVVGRHFSRAAVAHLLSRETTDLDARLESLRRSELIEPDTGWFLGEPALRFHHVLIRDAAYRRLLKGTRAELHGHVAGWIETKVGESVEHDETIGWHLEQAHQHLRELGPIDAQGRAFGDRAARYLAAAGRRALARDDLPLAAGLLGRALELLDGSDPARADLALDWCEALLAAGDVGPAAGAVDELGRFIDMPVPAPLPENEFLGSVDQSRLKPTANTSSESLSGDSSATQPGNSFPGVGTGADRLRAWHTCFAGQLAVLTDPQALRATADAVAAAVEQLAAAGDAAGEAKAHSVHALALQRLGKIGACEAALDKALAAARRADDRRRSNAVLAGAPLAALWGPSPVTRASGRCLDVVRVLRITQGAPAVEAVALRCQGVLEALRGRTDAARRMIASSRRMVEELGITQRLLEADVFAGFIELLEGDALAAERCLRTAYEGLRDHGLGIDAAQAAALLGRALLVQGRAQEAEALSHECEALAGDDLKAAIAWRGVRAEALARRGEVGPAVDLARAAVDIAAATDALLDHADARRALAVALHAAGRRAEADAEEVRAIELWDAKGATLLTERARGDVGSVHSAGPAPDDRAVPVRLMHRRVQANAATANATRLDAAAAARDADVFLSLLADGAEGVHHPTGTAYRERDALDGYRGLLRAVNLTFVHEPLATLGDSLALCRASVSFSALAPSSALADEDTPFGAVENESIVLIEVDAQGRRLRSEFFATNRLGDAVARLYERYADLLPDGPARVRAAATARSVGALLGPPSLDSYATAFVPDHEFVDHRVLGFGSAGGADAVLHGFRLLFESSTDIVVTIDDIVGLCPDALLTHFKLWAVDRAGGGTYERAFLLLWTFGSDGLVKRSEQWDPDREAEALARFDELAAAPPAMRFANAATRAIQRFERSWAERDWDGLLASVAPTLVMDDRRALVGLSVSGEDFLANLRFLFAMKSSRWRSDVLATRGERLALCHTSFAGEAGAGGAIEVEHVSLVEVDAGGRYTALVLFDPDALEAAYAELDQRYAADEGAPHADLLANWRAFRQATNARDWETAARLLPDDFTMFSHRRLASSGLRLSRDEFIASLSWGDDRGVRSEMRRDHLPRLSTRAAVEVATLHGSLDGGDFEQQIVLVVTHDRSRLRAFEAFDLDQLDAALACYEELAGGQPTGARIANAATRALAHGQDAWEAHDWGRFAALLSPAFFHADRRTLVQLELDREQYLDSIRPFFEMTTSAPTMEVLATRGNSLVMVRAMVRTGRQDTPDLVGPSEIEFIGVIEVDGAGKNIAMVQFDADDLDAAYAELDARYAAGEAAAYGSVMAVRRAFAQAVAARDWDVLAAQFAPDLVVTDHRPLGWETLRGPAMFVETFKSLFDLAPNARLRTDHVIVTAREALVIATWWGTREGGAFEAPRVVVLEHDASGRICREDFYNLDQLDQARARFEVLSARPPADPLRIPPNAATRASARWQEVGEAQDWNALEVLYAPTCGFDDRRRATRTNGDRAMHIANTQFIFSQGARPVRTLLATSGDRLALEHIGWTGSDDAPAYEIDVLCLTEVDADGRILARILFDPDDRRAASAEMYERYVGSDAGRWMPLKGVEFRRALAAHDLDRMRAVLPGDFFFHDHRRTGAGRIEGADQYVAWLGALFEQSPDAIIEPLYYVATEPHGFLAIGHTVGTNTAGGEFESVFVQLGLNRGDRPIGAELFEVEDLDLARARFEELRPDPLRIPPNAATRANERSSEPILARDWPALRALTSADFTFDDRRKRALVHGDLKLWIRNLDVVLSWGVTRRTRELIGTVGDRIALERFAFAAEAEVAIDGEFLRLTEVDAEGRLLAVIHFDLDDRRAASDEAQARFVNGEAAGCHAQALIRAFGSAMARHAWDDLRKYFVDGLVCRDRRKLSFGEIPCDKLIESLHVLLDLGPDVGGEILQVLAWNNYGSVMVIRQFGTTRDGGSFESVFVPLLVVRGEHIVAYEIFEVGDADLALARFEALQPDPTRIPPNAAARVRDRTGAAFAARDWPALRALVSEDFVYEDRTKRALLSGDVELWMASIQQIASGGGRFESERIATIGDRIVLDCLAWAGEFDEAHWEVDMLRLTEIDADGRLRASINFDLDDRSAAFAEAHSRFAAGEAAAVGGQAPFATVGLAFQQHDWETVRGCLADDAVIWDRRPLGIGAFHRDQWIDSLRALADLAPDVASEVFRILAWNRYGRVSLIRAYGSMRDAGPFENVFVAVHLIDSDRIQRYELFDVGETDRALARFAELCTPRPGAGEV